MKTDDIIEVKNLSKTYRVKKVDTKSIIRFLSRKNTVNKTALIKISFSVKRGESVGIIGKNGAGKSTLVKILTGILVPDSGYVSVMGRNPFRERIKNNMYIGVVFGQRTQLRWDLSPISSFLLLKKMYRVPDDIYESQIEYFSKEFTVGSVLNNPVRTLSLGEKMKCEIIAALLHRPKILFLDEPTIGLDILSKEVILNFLKKINEEQKITILLTTHDLNDIAKVCRRSVVLNEGVILVDKDVSEIVHLGNRFKDVRFTSTNSNPIVSGKIGDYEHSKESNRLSFNSVPIEKVSQVIKCICSDNEIVDVTVKESSFADVIKKIWSELDEIE